MVVLLADHVEPGLGKPLIAPRVIVQVAPEMAVTFTASGAVTPPFSRSQ
jgi:hypothetical protein